MGGDLPQILVAGHGVCAELPDMDKGIALSAIGREYLARNAVDGGALDLLNAIV